MRSVRKFDMVLSFCNPHSPLTFTTPRLKSWTVEKSLRIRPILLIASKLCYDLMTYENAASWLCQTEMC